MSASGEGEIVEGADGPRPAPWSAVVASLAFTFLYLVLKDSFIMFERGTQLAEAALQGPGGADAIAAFGRASAAATRGLRYYQFAAVGAVLFALWALRRRPRWPGALALGCFFVVAALGRIMLDFS